MTIKSFIKKGNSFPIILEDKGKNYFVKLRVGMSGKYALVNEWIGNTLGQQLSINTQTPIWIELDNEVIIDSVYIEVKELIYKSLGLNIGFPYHEAAVEIKGDKLQLVEERVAEEIFLFDLMMLNIDRTSSNTNLMIVKDEVISTDYESSLLFQDIIGNKNLIENDVILQCFKKNPLYKEIDEISIDNFLNRTKRLSIEETISEIPRSILGEKERGLFIKGIKHKQANQWFLKEIIENLQSIKIETEEEQKNRMKKNQEQFIRNLKKNSAPKNES